MPFASEMFNEACDKVVKHAKGEIEASINATIHGLGIEGLREKLASSMPKVPMLEAKATVTQVDHDATDADVDPEMGAKG
jgi:hypothetical protein